MCCVGLDIDVDVHDDCDQHGHHDHVQQPHEAEEEEEGVLAPNDLHRFEVEVAHQHPEGRGHRPVQRRKVLDLAAEEGHGHGRVGEEDRREDNQVMRQVRRGMFEGVGDQSQAGLRRECLEKAEHDDHRGHSAEDAHRAREVPGVLGVVEDLREMDPAVRCALEGLQVEPQDLVAHMLDLLHTEDPQDQEDVACKDVEPINRIPNTHVSHEALVSSLTRSHVMHHLFHLLEADPSQLQIKQNVEDVVPEICVRGQLHDPLRDRLPDVPASGEEKVHVGQEDHVAVCVVGEHGDLNHVGPWPKPSLRLQSLHHLLSVGAPAVQPDRLFDLLVERRLSNLPVRWPEQHVDGQGPCTFDVVGLRHGLVWALHVFDGLLRQLDGSQLPIVPQVHVATCV
mmetsp:Transcript_2524/g.9755  ORF Transcript_2524/g.9755 Transcript_2524/m.9755 type:complete len:395 (+) Transcript_2524:646-1830(+)